MKKIILNIFLVLFIYFFSGIIFASSPQEETLEASITKVIEEKQIEVMQKKQLYQKLELTVNKGSLKGNKIIIENGNIPLANYQRYYQGDRVFVSYSKDDKGNGFFLYS